ncbi:MAG TPA: NAD(P)/FAD-dependent oxidoreductase [Polyangiaceae bacterium]|jgi:geranylgeranyl reductase family protein|nr:NAD(P)/FAD-dependent oxidoreductase [Polyangiaceae bacterium]
MTHDVIVVGAGPGGATAALRLAGNGVRDVLLLDGATFPRDKTCGSGLSPTALELGDELGIGDEIRRRANPIESVKLVAPGGGSFVIASNAAAVVMLRREFDDLLVRTAQARGAKLEGGVRVRELVREGGRVVGVRTGDGRELRARYVLCADGAHSVFSHDPRPKQSISTLMGWWDDADFTPGQLEMVFDRNVSPLYGWLFPESDRRVNIGICIDGQEADGAKTRRNVRDVFRGFLADHYSRRLARATQVGAFKGHPIVYTTWIRDSTTPGALYLGEAARVTHNATGEGISHAMQSGIFAADTVSDVLAGRAAEDEAWNAYLWKHRRRFTLGFVAGHALRAVVRSGALDVIARAYENPLIRRGVVRTLGSALAGSALHAVPETPAATRRSPRDDRRSASL